jgi:hypothetical protein
MKIYIITMRSGQNVLVRMTDPEADRLSTLMELNSRRHQNYLVTGGYPERELETRADVEPTTLRLASGTVETNEIAAFHEYFELPGEKTDG